MTRGKGVSLAGGWLLLTAGCAGFSLAPPPLRRLGSRVSAAKEEGRAPPSIDELYASRVYGIDPGTPSSRSQVAPKDPPRAASEIWLERLAAYREQHGTCSVPQPYCTPDGGHKLGSWVSNARRKYREGRLKPELAEALAELGMVWDVAHAQWFEGYRELEVYRQTEGHCLVPQEHETEGSYRLGSWVSHQRRRYKAGLMTDEQSELLEALGMVWVRTDLMLAARPPRAHPRQRPTLTLELPHLRTRTSTSGRRGSRPF